MGIHSGPVQKVKDANDRENIAGVGINIAQRVMDCGDAGHILVSKRVAGDLAQQRRWQPYLHELGDVEVKHGVVLSLANFYAETIGNPTPPAGIGKGRRGVRALSKGGRKGFSSIARAIFIIVGLVIVLSLVLAIVSVIFAPAIVRSLGKSQVISPPPAPAIPSPPSIADTIKSDVAKKIKDEMENALAAKSKAEALRAAVGSTIPEKSIAVLPFENLSDDKSNAYFADGVQDEILTRLAKVADLKVISRTSTQHFNSAPDNLPQIAKQLGVAHILEGSVQKAGDQVRVNVQLINAMTDAHLWADTYDRKLIDIFSVESEIAKTIADTLQAKLSGSEKTAMSKKPTADPEAYELYLKGRFFWNKRTAANLQRSAGFYDQAIAKDPNYALAYAGLAEAYVLFPDYGVASPEECVPRVKVAATKALSLDPALAEPHAALGVAYCYYDYDATKSIAEFERAIQLNPNYATAHQWINTPLQMIGDFDRAIAENNRAIQLDPLSLIINSDLAFIYLNAHRFDDALEQSRKVLEMDPSFNVARGYVAEALQFKGKLPEAIVEYRKAAGSTDESSSLAQLAQACARAGQRDEAQQILARLLEKARTQYVSGQVIAWVYVGLGDKVHALESLETAYRQHASELTYAKYDPLLDELHGEPRFQALVQKVVGEKK
jgi:TolB-like protein/Tfp pilus assembly protein PilF